MPLPKNQYFPSGELEDLAKMKATLKHSGVPGVMYQAAKETYDNPIINNVLAALPVTGEAMLANDVANEWQKGNKWTAGGMGLAGMLPFGGMIGKTVWHGSPHIFDKFDLSKLGTGEGAQRYGHGLYLAESPDVAMGYKGKLSERNAPSADELLEYFKPGEIRQTRGGHDKIIGFDPETMTVTAQSVVQDNAGNWVKNPFSPKERMHKTMPSNLEFQRALGREPERIGALYKVDLPDEHIANMVDWDLPFANQKAHEILKAHSSYPDIKAAMAKEMKLYGLAPEDYSGAHFMRMMDEQHRMFDNPAARTSAVLQEAGIPGVQYLDQASRMRGDGTRNYVSFSDEIPQILERNGQPLDTLK